MKSKPLLHMVASPLFIAGILSGAVLPFVLCMIPPFQAKLTYHEYYSKEHCQVFWTDINNDDESEKIEWFTNSEGKATYKVIGQDGLLKDLRLFNGEALTAINPPLITDFNGDQYPDINAFYHRNDSLFFQTVSYHPESITYQDKEIFVTMVANASGSKDYYVFGAPFEDLDNDKNKDLIFTVMAGYPIRPRYAFYWSSQNKAVFQSSFTGGNSIIEHVIDLDQDGYKELLMTQYAPANMHGENIDGANDQSVRLWVLDNQLKPKFNPPVFGSGYSRLRVLPLNNEGYYIIVVLTGNASIPEENHHLMIYSANGTMIAKKKVDLKSPVAWLLYLNQPGLFHIYDASGQFLSFDLQLNLHGEDKLKWSGTKPMCLDINKDGTPEYLSFSISDHALIIARKGFKKYIKVPIPQTESTISLNSGLLKENKSAPNEIMVPFKSGFSLVSYNSNPWFWLRFPLIVAIYLFVTGIIFAIRKLQQLVLRDKYMAAKKISELQLLLMRNQLSPHFLFNAINSISFHLMEKDPVKANHSIIRLSKLIRNNLVSSDKLSRPIQEELDAVTSYLEIVSSQKEEPFSFYMRISPETNMAIHIPVLVIQNYVENAIKHGIGTLGRKGKIEVIIRQEKRFLHILIIDNGIGRVNAGKNQNTFPSTQKGMDLMQQLILGINKYNINKISTMITDLVQSDGSAAGTSVEIHIPIDMKYRIYE